MKHVVFDFDGTLVDSRQVGLEIYNAIAARRGFPAMSAPDAAALRGASMGERLRALRIPPWQLPGLVVEFTRLYRAALGGIAFYEGVPELLAALRERGLRLHVISSNAEENIREFLASRGDRCIETVASSRGLFGKHRTLRRFLRAQGAAAGEVLYVGDEQRDVVACREAGVRIAAVTWGFDAREVLGAADHVVDAPAELLALVDALRAR